MNKPTKFIAVTKENQHYLFRYHLGDEATLLHAVMRYVKDHTCNLNYADIIALMKRIRESILEDIELKEKV